ATLNLQNTLVAGNRAPSGPDLCGDAQAGSRSNLVGSGDSSLTGISNGVGGNLIGTRAEPIDPRLGPLADHGGPAPPHTPRPACPARAPGLPVSAGPTDHRGSPRVVQGEIDLGAYQTQRPVAGPQAVLSDPGGVVDPPVDHVRLTFNPPLDPASAPPARFALA